MIRVGVAGLGWLGESLIKDLPRVGGLFVVELSVAQEFRLNALVQDQRKSETARNRLQPRTKCPGLVRRMTLFFPRLRLTPS